MALWSVSTSQDCHSDMDSLGWVAIAFGLYSLTQAASVYVDYKRYRLEHRIHFPEEEGEPVLSPADILGEP